MSVMLVAMLGYLRSLSESISLSDSNRETVIAAHTLRTMLEEIRTVDFDDAFTTFNDWDDDDPGGKGTAAGSGFEVPQFTARRDDADGMVGQILFPTAPNRPDVLTELPDGSFPFLPRDLDLNGDETGGDVTAGHKILPIVVRLEWTGASGNRELEVATILSDL